VEAAGHQGRPRGRRRVAQEQVEGWRR
jgi:hypothetical protein